MRTIKRNISGGVLVSKDGKIFLGKHHAGGVYQDCWLIPGGGIEENETKEEALIREMREETGIDVSDCVIELVGTDAGTAEKTLKTTGERVNVEMSFYDFRVQLTHNADEMPSAPDDELTESNWFAIDELAALKLSPPTEKLFRKLGYLA